MSHKQESHSDAEKHQKPENTDKNPTSDAVEGSDISAELDKFRDLALRTAADFDNYRKRVSREKEDAIRYANASLLEDILPILDNFELGLEAARSAPGAEAILQGLDMVARQFQDFLTSVGVEEIKTDNVEFDPNFMEAIAHDADETVPENRVIKSLRRGYKLRERLLRPARVIVSKGKQG